MNIANIERFTSCSCIIADSLLCAIWAQNKENTSKKKESKQEFPAGTVCDIRLEQGSITSHLSIGSSC